MYLCYVNDSDYDKLLNMGKEEAAIYMAKLGNKALMIECKDVQDAVNTHCNNAIKGIMRGLNDYYIDMSKEEFERIVHPSDAREDISEFVLNLVADIISGKVNGEVTISPFGVCGCIHKSTPEIEDDDEEEDEDDCPKNDRIPCNGDCENCSLWDICRFSDQFDE